MCFRAVIFFLFIQAIKSSCPDGSVGYQTRCFLFNTTRHAFARAEVSCNEVNGHLVSIHDAFENAIIGEYAPDYFTENDYWIGSDKFISQGTWTWTDGTNFDYNDWQNGKPQNQSGYDCIAITVKDGYWNAQECFQPKPFVCDVSKMPTTSTTTTLKPTTTATPTISYVVCPSGWTRFKNSCYLLNSILTTNWTQSESYCNSFGAHSASIHDDEERDFIYYVFVRLQYVPWLGLFSDDSGKTWKWTDGTPVDYFSWFFGKPTIYGGRNCVLLTYTSEISGFEDYDCSWPWYALCKKSH
jgi:hypothetical protein